MRSSATKLIQFLILWLACCSAAFALHLSKTEKQSTLHLLTNVDVIKPGDSFWVMLHTELKPGWNTYWKNPGDSGLPPKLEIELPNSLTYSDLQFLPPKKIQISDLVDYGYEKDAYFLFEVSVPDDYHQPGIPITLTFNWVVCSDICVPETADILFSLPVGSQSIPSIEADLIETKRQVIESITTIQADVSIQDKTIEISLPILPKSLTSPYLFVSERNIVKPSSPQVWQSFDTSVKVQLERSFDIPTQVSGFVKLNEADYIQFVSNSLEYAPGSSSVASMSIYMAMAFAFLGGILLNIMPCVFPILTLKIVSLAKLKGKLVHQRIFHGIVYSLGILIAFFILAALIALIQHAGILVGWGFQMQSPYFLCFMTYVLFLVAMNLFGFVEFIIPLPIGQEEHPYSLKASFMAGLLVALIATPCTAPFMAPAIGFALTQPLLVICVTFLALGLGLAFPFLFVSLIPPLVKFIPKPGIWLLHFKQVLAFPMLLSSVWLLWILIKITSANFVAAVMIGLTAIAFYLWFNHTYKEARKTSKALVFIFALLFALLPIYGPMTTPKSTETAFNISDLQNYLQQHKNVLVDVTADWCITCKVNESLVFDDQEVQHFFEKHGITIYTVDWTKPNSEIAAYLQQFGRSGVPLYVFYPIDGEPVLLPQVLTKSTLLDILNDNL